MSESNLTNGATADQYRNSAGFEQWGLTFLAAANKFNATHCQILRLIGEMSPSTMRDLESGIHLSNSALRRYNKFLMNWDLIERVQAETRVVRGAIAYEYYLKPPLTLDKLSEIEAESDDLLNQRKWARILLEAKGYDPKLVDELLFLYKRPGDTALEAEEFEQENSSSETKARFYKKTKLFEETLQELLTQLKSHSTQLAQKDAEIIQLREELTYFETLFDNLSGQFSERYRVLS